MNHHIGLFKGIHDEINSCIQIFEDRTDWTSLTNRHDEVLFNSVLIESNGCITVIYGDNCSNVVHLIKRYVLLIRTGLWAHETFPIKRPPLSPFGSITLLMSFRVFWLEIGGDRREATGTVGICWT